MCPWERHFTPISSLYPGINGHLTLIGGGKMWWKERVGLLLPIPRPRHSNLKTYCPYCLDRLWDLYLYHSIKFLTPLHFFSYLVLLIVHTHFGFRADGEGLHVYWLLFPCFIIFFSTPLHIFSFADYYRKLHQIASKSVKNFARYFDYKTSKTNTQTNKQTSRQTNRQTKKQGEHNISMHNCDGGKNLKKSL